MRAIAGAATGSADRADADHNLRPPHGTAVKWDTPKAKKLFADLRNDTPLTITK